VVDTGISVELPVGTYGRVVPQSGLALKHGITIGAGVIDQDYTGNIKVLIFNQGE
jgi:dUTP pyrophosphatase